MSAGLRVALAQLDLLVGDVRGNCARVRDAARKARAQGADLVIFPELTLCGYPPEDLLFHRGLRIQVEQALAELERDVNDPACGLPAILVGYPEYAGSTGTLIYNSACPALDPADSVGDATRRMLADRVTDLPVVDVSWLDAVHFCNALSRLAGRG